MKYLGIDFGSRRVGIAVSDDTGSIAFPRTVLANDRGVVAEIQKIVADETIEHVIVGDTRTIEGAANPITKDADTFIKTLASVLAIPVTPMWEGWSSVEAARYAPKGEEHNDAAAAAIILQRYVDTHAINP